MVVEGGGEGESHERQERRRGDLRTRRRGRTPHQAFAEFDARYEAASWDGRCQGRCSGPGEGRDGFGGPRGEPRRRRPALALQLRRERRQGSPPRLDRGRYRKSEGAEQLGGAAGRGDQTTRPNFSIR